MSMDLLVSEIVASLKSTQSYCVVHDFTRRAVGDDVGLCAGMLEEMKAFLGSGSDGTPDGSGAEQKVVGAYHAGELAGDGGFWQTKYDPSKRSDFVHWITEKQLRDGNSTAATTWLLRYFELTQRVASALVAAQASAPLPLNADGTAVPSLSCDRMMLALYPVSRPSRFQVHVDNPNGNGRVLTFTYYLNRGWDAQRDGGCLEILPKGQKGVVVVPPVADTLCVFFSDDRTPHEVKPTAPSDHRRALYAATGDPAHLYRFSITTWYSYLTPQQTAAAFQGAFAQWIERIKARKQQETVSDGGAAQ